MKQFFTALLFVLSVAEVSSSTKITGKKCTSGSAVVELFGNPCPGGESPFRKLWRENRGLLTQMSVVSLRNYATKVCSEAMPRVRQCFAEAISDCDADQQRYLNSLAQQTRTICKANGTEIAPWMNHLLDRLTDSDLVADDSCRSNSTSLFDHCWQAASAVEGMGDFEASQNFFQTANISQLVASNQRVFHNFIACFAANLQYDPNRCPDWRRHLLRPILVLLRIPVVGLQVNYTPAMVDLLFEFAQAGRHRGPPSF
ncbi:uncharacterized protein LOC143276582 isoform X2 [Babylonia areolata]|uniref:uncharacterized protein LOC143276582 isoform X2 n=1 Tax=Babylonia areolata TaxID=304850 RepID=UPI003FD31DF2